MAPCSTLVGENARLLGAAWWGHLELSQDVADEFVPVLAFGRRSPSGSRSQDPSEQPFDEDWVDRLLRWKIIKEVRLPTAPARASAISSERALPEAFRGNTSALEFALRGSVSDARFPPVSPATCSPSRAEVLTALSGSASVLLTLWSNLLKPTPERPGHGPRQTRSRSDLSGLLGLRSPQRQFKAKPAAMTLAKCITISSDGGEVLDAVAGLWCCNAGHNRRAIVEAIQRQAAEVDYSPAFSDGPTRSPSNSRRGLPDLAPEPRSRVLQEVPVGER